MVGGVADGNAGETKRKQGGRGGSPTTYLLELELGPATNVGVRIEGSDDVALHSDAVHRGQVVRPILASSHSGDDE